MGALIGSSGSRFGPKARDHAACNFFTKCQAFYTRPPSPSFLLSLGVPLSLAPASLSCPTFICATMLKSTPVHSRFHLKTLHSCTEECEPTWRACLFTCICGASTQKCAPRIHGAHVWSFHVYNSNKPAHAETKHTHTSARAHKWTHKNPFFFLRITTEPPIHTFCGRRSLSPRASVRSVLLSSSTQRGTTVR